ncbi:hypothetical protein [Paenibacillus sp. FSL L8-0708]|uniref:hypothetical protein n=1 Tax=Paenibacillus sp. FSL L8-0708 TaxID=2975311 RepID=UPI0030FC06C8
MSMIALDHALRGASKDETTIKKEDVKNTEAFLRAYLPMLKVVKDYEAAAAIGSLSNNDLTNLEAYQFYKSITDFTISTINNLSNPYERLIMEKLYIQGLPYKKAAMYMRMGYSSKLNPISLTSFADRKRKALVSIAKSLNIIGILEKLSSETTRLYK